MAEPDDEGGLMVIADLDRERVLLTMHRVDSPAWTDYALTPARARLLALSLLDEADAVSPAATLRVAAVVRAVVEPPE